jgi:hypothetical protein
LVLFYKREPSWTSARRRATENTAAACINLDNVYTFVYYEKSDVMAELSFEWDEEKNAANIKNHGIDFLDAALIFGKPDA